MKKIPAAKILLPALLLLSICNTVAATDSTNYFRQKNVYTLNGQPVFDIPQWKIHLDGPVRASAAYDKTNIYIGTARGTFYAINNTNGNVVWTYTTNSAIHSTALYDNGKLYFTDNKQTLYCLAAKEGKLLWKHPFGNKLAYEWKFDYYYSSPVLYNNTILVGSDDGYMNCIDKNTGKEIWKYNAGAVVRASATVDEGVVYFGDCSGLVYAINAKDGKEIWKYETNGYNIILGGEWYFDRKAILATVAIANGLCIVGSRDGFLYAIDKRTGKTKWSVDYSITWIISSAVIKDGIIITGTSDGRYINALELLTGKEIWKFNTKQVVWSSPTLINDLVYLPSNDGILHILNYKTGEKVSEFRTVDNSTPVFSSPVFTGSAVVYGTDAGDICSLTSRAFSPQEERQTKKYVFWMDSIAFYFKNGMDIQVKNYLTDNGYTLIDSSVLIHTMQDKAAAGKMVIAFASNYFPDSLWRNESRSILRQYLDAGGKAILFGFNPVVYDLPHNKFNFSRAKETLDINYGPDDLRSFHGWYAAFATATGQQYFLPPFWTAICSVKKEEVDTVLGEDENGLASAWVKYYGPEKRGALIQVWLDAGKPVDYNFIKFLKDIH